MATTAMMSVDPMQPAAVATASGWIALLQETEPTLKSHALQKLLDCVDTLWHEVAESLPDLEAIAEDADCPTEMRQRAAAVASRVFFHLEEPTQALRLALEAGEGYFDVRQTTPYVERLVAAALDAYVQERRRLVADDEEPIPAVSAKKRQSMTAEEIGLPIDQLQALVHRLLESCCASGKYDHALESPWRLVKLKKSGMYSQPATLIPTCSSMLSVLVSRLCNPKLFDRKPWL
jgi:26S proteasome regulatory subunit N2